jgi:hypothetical protein
VRLSVHVFPCTFVADIFSLLTYYLFLLKAPQTPSIRKNRALFLVTHELVAQEFPQRDAAVQEPVTDRLLEPEHAAALELITEQRMLGEHPDLELLQTTRTA